MKIGIISDTHARKNISRLTDIITSRFKDVDIIMHAGDYTTSKVIYMIKKFKPFAGVFGNNDGDDVKKLVKEKEIYTAFNKRIGLCHSYGNGDKALDCAYDIFKDDNVDIIIFGHSHQPIITTKGRILMLNPGSLTHKKSGGWNSYIILTIEKENAHAELYFY